MNMVMAISARETRCVSVSVRASHIQDNDNDDAEWRHWNESRQHESGRLCLGLAQVTRANLHAGHVQSVSLWMCVRAHQI